MARPRTVREQVGLDPSEEEVAAQQQADEQAQAEAQAAEEAAQRPEWLPEGMDSPERLAEAYRAAERERGRLAQELGDARDQISEFALQQTQPQQYQPQYDPSVDPRMQQLQNAWDQGDMAQWSALYNQYIVQPQIQAAVGYSQQQVQQPQGEILAALAENQVASRYGDQWTDDFRQEVGQLLQQYPHLVPDGGSLDQMAQGLGLAAELVAQRKQAEAQGAQSAQEQASRQQKMLAQSATGSTGRVGSNVNPADALIEQMKAQKVQGYNR